LESSRLEGDEKWRSIDYCILVQWLWQT